MTEATAHPVRRALTGTEMASITAAIDAAGNATELVAETANALYSALLTSLGKTLADYGHDHRLDPSMFAIPEAQWMTIVQACVSKAGAFGAAVHVALELAGLMPPNYEDPHVTVEAPPVVDHRPAVHQLTVAREAVDGITAASRYCERLAEHYGSDSPQYREAVGSWQHHLSHLFAMAFGARTRITRDDDLSLLVRSETSFTYALTFHPVPRRCTNPGCRAWINDDGHAWTYHSEDPACPDGQHAPSYPLDVPKPGRWQFHS